VRHGHLADNHCLKFVLWLLPANDCDHGVQLGRIDFAIFLAECLGDTFHFDMGNGLTRRAKGRHELGAPAVPIRMRWPFDNLGCTVFSLDSRADLKTRRHFRNRLLRCSDGAFLGIVWVPDYRWQRL